jgi:dCMP deaminase
MKRPEQDEYFMRMAMTARSRANCLGRKVGAVLVRESRVIAAGYNGVPEGMMNCEDGGCERCAGTYEPNEGYDVCICVHAEQNAILSAARFGASVGGAVLYSTMQPCFGCLKESLQADLLVVYYLHEWVPRPELQGEYKKIQAALKTKQVKVVDRQANWANNAKPVTKTVRNIKTAGTKAS